jgi:putative membrane protein
VKIAAALCLGLFAFAFVAAPRSCEWGLAAYFWSGVATIVALLHLYFLVLEMFFWDKPLGLRTFGLTPEFAQASKALAANQGLYNGFLVAGLVWGFSLGQAGTSIKLFFLGCVIVAGVFGAMTANRRILWVQALPGAIALALVLAS